MLWKGCFVGFFRGDIEFSGRIGELSGLVEGILLESAGFSSFKIWIFYLF